MVFHEKADVYSFRVYLPEASVVELVAGFTEWRARAVRMHREPTGWWSVTTSVPPGDHDFSYLVDGSAWIPDYAANGIRRNGFGGWVSQIHVPATATVELRREMRMAA